MTAKTRVYHHLFTLLLGESDDAREMGEARGVTTTRAVMYQRQPLLVVVPLTQTEVAFRTDGEVDHLEAEGDQCANNAICEANVIVYLCSMYAREEREEEVYWQGLGYLFN